MTDQPCPFCEINTGRAPATVIRELRLGTCELRVDTIRDVRDREVGLPSRPVASALAGQTRSSSTSQVRCDKVWRDQPVSALANIDPVAHLRWVGRRECGAPLDRRSLCGHERLGHGVELRHKAAHLAALTGAFMLPLEPVADHTRRDSGRSVGRSAQCAFPSVMRSAQRAVRVLRVESGVVQRALGGHPQQLRWYVHPQGHFNPSLTSLIGQFARHTCERAPSSNMDRVVRGLGLARRSTTSVAVDPASEPSCSKFVSACSVSARDQRSTVAANPGLPTSGAALVHAPQSTVKLPQQQAELPRAENDGLALPWYSGRSKSSVAIAGGAR